MPAFHLCLRCPVHVAALRRADPPSKESYQLSACIRFRNSEDVRPWTALVGRSKQQQQQNNDRRFAMKSFRFNMLAWNNKIHVKQNVQNLSSTFNYPL
jgi:hypothetical protein